MSECDQNRSQYVNPATASETIRATIETTSAPKDVLAKSIALDGAYDPSGDVVRPLSHPGGRRVESG